MDFRTEEFAPPEGLKGLLRASFFARGESRPADTILPDGLAVVAFNAGAPHRLGKSAVAKDNEEFPHGWLRGVQTTPVHDAPGEETHVLGLVFEPPGLHVLFGVDMRALADAVVDARDVLPTDFIAIAETALAHADDPTVHAALHAALLARPRAPLPAWLKALYDAICETRGELRLAHAYAAAGVSAADAEEEFKAAVGVTPRTLCRIHRLRALLEAVDPRADVDWPALARRFGYDDPAAFDRDFTAFAGAAPDDYLARLN